MIQKLIESRRLKLLYIPEQAIAGMFDRVKPYDWIRRPYFALPEGTTVVKAILSPERSAFGFLLHNPNWPAIPPCEIPPELSYIEIVLQMPKICDFCKKEVSIGKFCTCKAPTGFEIKNGPRDPDLVPEIIQGASIIQHDPMIVDSEGGEKLCPKCGTKMPYYVYDCPKCHYDFN